jgi:hypothetical protein
MLLIESVEYRYGNFSLRSSPYDKTTNEASVWGYPKAIGQQAESCVQKKTHARLLFILE